LAISVLLLLLNILRSLKRGAFAGDDPWQAHTLEWSVSSPPPPYNFEVIPAVVARYALWTRPKHGPHVRGLRGDRREVLVTRILDAEPDHRVELPGPTLFPLLAAISTAVAFVVSIFTPWGIVIGACLLAAALTGWYWPRLPFKEELAVEQPALSPVTREEAERASRDQDEQRAKSEELTRGAEPQSVDVSHLATEAFGSRAPLWWGVALMIAIESTVFGLLFISYFYLRDRALDWPPTPLPALHAKLAALAALLLLVSIVPGILSARAARVGNLVRMRWALFACTLLGGGFFALRYYELSQLPFRWDSHVHGSLFWLLAGMHLMHVITSCGENLLMLLVLFFGPLEEKQLVDVEVNSLYWNFVVASGLATVAISYVDPLLFARGGP
jgi:heme/copper-type cytochrome/quinol oxidase subunit 3